MKRGILLLLLISSVFVHAQTLKDALFSGKLKNEPGTVIRKGDDLSSKMDSTNKVTDETSSANTIVSTQDSSTQTLVNKPDSTAASVNETDNNATTTETTAPASKRTVPALTNNTAIWKVYMDSVASELKTEVLSSKKVKRGDYFIMVSYIIDTDGQVTVSDVSLSPENAYLQQQIKEKLAADTPRLNPVLNSVGAPRKVTKKYSFTLSKQ